MRRCGKKQKLKKFQPCEKYSGHFGHFGHIFLVMLRRFITSRLFSCPFPVINTLQSPFWNCIQTLQNRRERAPKLQVHMATKYKITAEQNTERQTLRAKKDEAISFEIDFSPWAEDNDDVSTVTWTVRSGYAESSNTALSSNVASGLVTLSECGRSMIEVKATTASNQVKIVHIETLATDPSLQDDYGF
jgi:hypothetical protein